MIKNISLFGIELATRKGEAGIKTPNSVANHITTLILKKKHQIPLKSEEVSIFYGSYRRDFSKILFSLKIVTEMLRSHTVVTSRTKF